MSNNTFSNDKHCHYCKAILTYSQSIAGNVCSNIQCILSWRDDLQGKENLRKQKKHDIELAFVANAKSYCNELLKNENNEIVASVAIGIVPANEAEVTDLPQTRIDEFISYLIKCAKDAERYLVAENFESTIKPSQTDSLINAETEFERKALVQACSTCKGFCCLKGGEKYAYQDVNNMLHFMQNTINKDSKAIIQEYLDYIPAQSYKNSCVYHTEDGCNLPRNMRAEICNKHLCKGLLKIKKEYYDSSPSTMFIVAENTFKIVRSTLISKDFDTKHYNQDE